VKLLRTVCAALWCLFWAGSALALSPDQTLRIAQGESDDRIAALNEVVLAADPALAAYVQALLADEVKLAGGKVYIVRGDQVTDAASGAAATLPADAEDVVNPNRVRRELEAALSALNLFSPDRAVRLKAVVELKEQADEGKLALFEKAAKSETDPEIRAALAMLKATALIASSDKAQRLAAAQLLAESDQPSVKGLLIERLAAEEDGEVKAALQRTLDTVNARLAWGERLGLLFTGVSLGSILLLAALGLAITYGLMGVINMAHGELIMIGAYATWAVQNLFRQYLPGLFDA
jgi:urea transport system permease protein